MVGNRESAVAVKSELSGQTSPLEVMSQEKKKRLDEYFKETDATFGNKREDVMGTLRPFLGQQERRESCGSSWIKSERK